MYVNYLIKNDNIASRDTLLSELLEYLQQFNVVEEKYSFNLDTMDLLNEYTSYQSLYELAQSLLKDLVDINQLGLGDVSFLVKTVRDHSNHLPELDRDTLSRGLTTLDPKDIPSYLDMTKDRVIKFNEEIEVRNKNKNKYGLGLLALYACLHNATLTKY